MNDINLPPFFVGQKVVALTNSNNGFRREGIIYNVRGLIKKKCCGVWCVDIGNMDNKMAYAYCTICDKALGDYGFITWHVATAFAPIEEQTFSQVTYSKVLETVPCCNN